MLGTIVNVIAILVGSIIGMMLRKGIKEKYRNCLYNAMGLAAIGIGLNAVVQNMPNSIYPVLFIVSLALGSLIGTMLELDDRFNKITDKHSKGGNLGQGLSTAILLFCIGTLSILGPIEAALNQNYTYLFTNATLDLVTSLVLASTYGIGIAAAAGVLFLWQGSIYLMANSLADFLVGDLLVEISLVGGFLIAASGFGILGIKNFKTLNMLPALFIPPIWFLIMML
ncbi:MAG: DUF554 domain-containing protein [Clostridiales bacterium]|nr:DUF554 domain-containing protein [Clostridiales bacterium]